ncbi:MAG: glycosyltransferase, partial [bacterium]|nr:glycosyltransferase [bacterium]
FKYIQNFPFEVIITMDGDGQHSAKDLSAFIKAIEKKRKIGIIVGRRKIKGTDMPIIRRLTNLSMSLLISLLTFQWIPDSQNGFRAIRKNVLEKINPITDHFETETEILLRASWQGIKISSVPVTTIYGKEKSKIKPVRDTIKFCLMLLKIVFLAWKRK